ncbi:flagellar hook basal-body protein [Liquorilactobacillus mali]|uniref:Flagellar basal-body rod protein n=1 Tax=Liquorilactobacillus mali TaxID=1618 RepID=A0A0R2FSY1_9LACO|nr:flagellar hook basal-body protein [Liquorilactobacillus mali]KRN30731.1 flagellar basal-body rod protein [Liquorilactobacillus mali]MDN7145707.1 flagellar hook basal-body protein [Liquorilactobacillus mali]
MNISGILSINKSGMNGLQNNMDNIANNIANSDTTGYKSRNTAFQELVNNQTTAEEVNLTSGTSLGLNAGVGVNGESIAFTQGSLQQTGITTDLAIQGQGFFGVYGQDGQLLLTRDGSFKRDSTGQLVDASGNKVAIDATIPETSWPSGELSVASDGSISIVNNGNSTAVGKIRMYLPQNNEDLVSAGNNNYTVVNGDQLQVMTNPNIKQGYLETSTVDLADSMTDMIATQRAYQMNAKALQSTDDMFEVIDRLAD